MINRQKCVMKTLTQTLTLLTLPQTLKAIFFHNAIHALSIQGAVGPQPASEEKTEALYKAK